ncbi:MAG: type II secretion system protein [Methylobacter sp.]|nr:type II secretion system protein [Methylobacter sp.]
MTDLSNQEGFTLVELVMVIVVLGILSATALPKFFSISSYQQQAFFDDTLSAVRYAQKMAVATGCKVQVSINANAYVLNRPANRSQCLSNTAVFSLPVRNPATGDTSYTYSQAGVSLTSNHSTFYFDALGRASANVLLTVAGVKTITVVSETGFVYGL